MMTQTLTPSATLVSLLKGIAAELVSGSQPEVDLYNLKGNDSIVLNDAEIVSSILTEEVRALSHGRFSVSPVSYVYFDLRVMGRATYLGLYDNGDLSRRLFTVGGYRPGLSWNEELTGDALVSALKSEEDSRRRRQYRETAEDDAKALVFWVANRVKGFFRIAPLTPQQREDLEEHMRNRKFEDLSGLDLLLGRRETSAPPAGG